MARILLCHFSPVHRYGKYQPISFFDAMAHGFQEAGHDVFQMISTSLLPRYWNGTNDVYADVDQDRLRAKFKEINPDLCIFGNNSVPRFVYEETTCPVVLWLSDTVQFFNDLDRLKRGDYLDRVFFYAPFKRDINEIEALFGPDRARIIHDLPATGVQAQGMNFAHNVSFIGSTFSNGPLFASCIKGFKDKSRLSSIVNLVKHDPLGVVEKLTPSDKQIIESVMPISLFVSAFSGQTRLQTLSALSELGLALFGGDDWYDVSNFFPDVAASYIPRRVYSLAHNAAIYNSSKICLNISHAQAVDGFPWRVMDIMASNGCLLSDRKQGLAEFFKGYGDLPMYETTGEARDIAERLLKDEVWRQEVVANSQRCIADKGRWKHRLPAIENATGVRLTDNSSTTSTITSIYGEDYRSKLSATYTIQRLARNKNVRQIAEKVLVRCLSAINRA